MCQVTWQSIRLREREAAAVSHFRSVTLPAVFCEFKAIVLLKRQFRSLSQAAQCRATRIALHSHLQGDRLVLVIVVLVIVVLVLVTASAGSVSLRGQGGW